jgi:hypothetical protein
MDLPHIRRRVIDWVSFCPHSHVDSSRRMGTIVQRSWRCCCCLQLSKAKAK